MINPYGYRFSDNVTKGEENWAFQMAAAPFRAAEGLFSSVYNLADFVSFDALPDYGERKLGTSEFWAASLLEGGLQFLVPFGTLTKGAKALTSLSRFGGLATRYRRMSKVGQWAVRDLAGGALVDMVAFEGNEGRLADLLVQFPELQNPLTEYLASDEDDGFLEARLKNAIEGGILGSGVDGLMAAFSGVRRKIRGSSRSRVAANGMEDVLSVAERQALNSSTAKFFREVYGYDHDEVLATEAVIDALGLDRSRIILDEDGRLFLDHAANSPEILAKLERGEINGYTIRGQELGTVIIGGFKNADASTGLHEILHATRSMLFDMRIDSSLRTGVTDEMIHAAAKWAGAVWDEATGTYKWGREAEEKFARAGELYFRDGKAPSPELESLFEKFTEFLTKIYRKVSGSAIDVDLSPEMKDIFDRLVQRGKAVPDEDLVARRLEAVGRPDESAGEVLLQLQRSFLEPISDELRDEAPYKLRASANEDTIHLAHEELDAIEAERGEITSGEQFHRFLTKLWKGKAFLGEDGEMMPRQGQFIGRLLDDPAYTKEFFGKASDEQIEAAQHGLETAAALGELYAKGDPGADTTLMTAFWAILSRSAAVAPQETAFVDSIYRANRLMSRILDHASNRKAIDNLDDVLTGEMQWTADILMGKGLLAEAMERIASGKDFDDAFYLKWDAEMDPSRTKRAGRFEREADLSEDGGLVAQVKEIIFSGAKVPDDLRRRIQAIRPDDEVLSQPRYTHPGVSVVSNVNSAGLELFRELFRPTKDGRTKIQVLHDMLVEGKSGREIRRWWHGAVQGAGMDNKILSFMLLVLGKEDVMVWDRVRYSMEFALDSDENVYSSLTDAAFGKLEKEVGSEAARLHGRDGFATTGNGLYGVAFSEASESAVRHILRTQRPMPEGLNHIGGFHWLSWVIHSGQVTSHASVERILDYARATPEQRGMLQEMFDGTLVTEQRYEQKTFGHAFGYIDGQPAVVIADPVTGSPIRVEVDDWDTIKTILQGSSGYKEALAEEGMTPSVTRALTGAEFGWIEHKKKSANWAWYNDPAFADNKHHGELLRRFYSHFGAAFQGGEGSLAEAARNAAPLRPEQRAASAAAVESQAQAVLLGRAGGVGEAFAGPTARSGGGGLATLGQLGASGKRVVKGFRDTLLPEGAKWQDYIETVHAVDGARATGYKHIGIPVSDPSGYGSGFAELKPAGESIFREAAERARAADPENISGAIPDDLPEGSRMLISPTGEGGLLINGDEVLAVFDIPRHGSTAQLADLAISNGINKVTLEGPLVTGFSLVGMRPISVDGNRVTLVRDPEFGVVVTRENAADFVRDGDDLLLQESAKPAIREDLWDLGKINEKQEIGSGNTSRNQIPGGMRVAIEKGYLKAGMRNVDIGGGKFDKGTQFLRENGVDSEVFDPFTRDAGHNRRVRDSRAGGQSDSATVLNVLNVIREPEARAMVLERALDALRPGGRLVVQVYEGGGGGGKVTRDGWQENRKLSSYLDEVRQVFPNAEREGGLIVATKDVPGTSRVEAARAELEAAKAHQLEVLKATRDRSPYDNVPSRASAQERVYAAQQRVYEAQQAAYREGDLLLQEADTTNARRGDRDEFPDDPVNLDRIHSNEDIARGLARAFDEVEMPDLGEMSLEEAAEDALAEARGLMEEMGEGSADDHQLIKALLGTTHQAIAVFSRKTQAARAFLARVSGQYADYLTGKVDLDTGEWLGTDEELAEALRRRAILINSAVEVRRVQRAMAQALGANRIRFSGRFQDGVAIPRPPIDPSAGEAAAGAAARGRQASPRAGGPFPREAADAAQAAREAASSGGGGAAGSTAGGATGGRGLSTPTGRVPNPTLPGGGGGGGGGGRQASGGGRQPGAAPGEEAGGGRRKKRRQKKQRGGPKKTALPGTSATPGGEATPSSAAKPTPSQDGAAKKVPIPKPASDSKALEALIDKHGGRRKVIKMLSQDLVYREANPGASVVVKPRNFWSMLPEYWMNNLLSGPITFAVNLASNSIRMLADPIERGLGNLLTGQAGQARRELSELVAMAQELREAVKLSAVALKEDTSKLVPGGGGGLDEFGRSTRAISADGQGVGRETVTGKALDWLGKFVNIPSRLLMGSDEFYKQWTYRSRMLRRTHEIAFSRYTDATERAEFIHRMMRASGAEGQVYTRDALRREASKQAAQAGLTGNEADKFILQYMDQHWDSEVGREAAKALQSARESTFTQDLEKTASDRGILSMMTGGRDENGARVAGPGLRGTINLASATLADAVGKVPALRFIFPFIRTPTNIMQYFLDRSVGVVSEAARLLVDGELRRASTKADLADLAGRASTGAVLFGSAVMLAMQKDDRDLPMLTGAGPDNPDERKMWQASGWQPYSIRVGDRYISYRRLDPSALFFGMVADLVQNKAHAEMLNQQPEYGKAVFVALVNNLASKSYLTGALNLARLFNSPAQEFQYVYNGWVTGFAPHSSFVHQALNPALKGDEVFHELRTAADAFASRSFWKDPAGNPTKYDFLGRPVKRDAGIGPDWGSPLRTTEASDDALFSELIASGASFGPPRETDGNVDLTSFRGPDGVQTAYDRWLQLHGEVKLGKRGLEAALRRVTQSKGYKQMSPVGFDQVDSPRVSLLRRVYSAYRTKAKIEMLKEFPELRKALDKQRRDALLLARGENRNR